MAAGSPEGRSSSAVCPRDWIFLVATLVIASGLRFYHLGRLSLWYDEVITVRLARTTGPKALVTLLDQIDATRAPLHPLLLQAWFRMFGPSELAGRAFSAICGVLTVGLIFWVGRLAFDTRTGLWGAWLSAWSPAFVQYSQEIRMYEWLVLLTCLAWGLLLSVRGRLGRAAMAAYPLVLAALIYSHPLGLIMVATLGLASLVHRARLGFTWTAWVVVYAATLLIIAPWLPHYFNHAPAYLVGRLPLRYLLGLPIGFIGGNSLTMIPLAAIIVVGLVGVSEPNTAGRPKLRLEEPVSASCLVLWLVVPPLTLYVYSWVKHPIFGPARYTLFVAPAYLVLVAHGLSKLPGVVRFPLAALGVALSASLLSTLAYDQGLKTDWRGVAAYLDQHAPGEPVILCGIDSMDHPSFITARYYLGDRRPLVLAGSAGHGPIPGSTWRVITPVPKTGRSATDHGPGPALEHAGRVIDLQGVRVVGPR